MVSIQRCATIMALAVMPAGCSSNRSEDPTPTPTASPALESVAPDSGPAGIAYPIRIVLSGTGFMPTGNTVRFGPVTLQDIASSDGGTRITLEVPKEMPSGGEAPPFVLQPGSYEISVTTAQGTTGTVTFELIRGGFDLEGGERR